MYHMGISVLQQVGKDISYLLCLPCVSASENRHKRCKVHFREFKVHFVSNRVMHDEVSDTENIRKNLAIERTIVEGCDILLDTSQTFIRQGKTFFFKAMYIVMKKLH